MVFENLSLTTGDYTLGLIMYLIGLFGIIFNHKNFLITMMSVELMYLGILFSFIITAIFFNDPAGQIYSLLIVVLAASESAVGLGILIVLYRFSHSIRFEHYQELRG